MVLTFALTGQCFPLLIATMLFFLCRRDLEALHVRRSLWGGIFEHEDPNTTLFCTTRGLAVGSTIQPPAISSSSWFLIPCGFSSSEGPTHMNKHTKALCSECSTQPYSRKMNIFLSFHSISLPLAVRCCAPSLRCSLVVIVTCRICGGASSGTASTKPSLRT